MKYDYLKVLLYGYSKMDMLAESVEEGARVSAKLSFRNYGNVLTLAEKIATEMFVSERLQAWKHALDECLCQADQEELFLLEYKYFRRKKVLANHFSDWVADYSERSYFRKQNDLLRRLASKLAAHGYTEEAFFNDFAKFMPFMRVYAALKSGWERKLVARRKTRDLNFRQNSVDSTGTEECFPRRTKRAIASTVNPTAQITMICKADSGCSGVGSEIESVGSDGAEASIK